MIGAVNAVSPAAAPADGKAARTSPDLQAQLNTYRAKLEDWVTCPSAKTPEGKAKIKEITTQFDAIKRQIDQRAQRTASERRSDTGSAGTTQGTASAAHGALGNHLDAYA